MSPHDAAVAARNKYDKEIIRNITKKRPANAPHIAIVIALQDLSEIARYGKLSDRSIVR